MKSKSAPSGILLYAKSSGPTSFSSLWSIKHALGTDKVGHTGTLDSFADGLLVVLTGNLTHLVPHVTGFTKSYEAVVCFGKETDTLDPTGEIIKTSAPVLKEQLENILPEFKGTILQAPPAFSALHVNGMRASDLVREGVEVNLEKRQIFIYNLELCDFLDAQAENGCTYAKLKITCSKGTYIRALARDIAERLGSCAYLCALRRTQVGPFNLKDAACNNLLGEFTIQSGIKNEEKIRLEDMQKKIEQKKNLLEKAQEKIFNKKNKTPREKDSDEKVADIKSHFLFFTKELAALCGFESYYLKPEAEKNYNNGKPLSLKMFEHIENENISRDFYVQAEAAVFYKNRYENFAGIIKKRHEHLSYGFVIHPEKRNLKVFDWKEICDGAFPVQWKNKGSAITVGSFEAVHKGHQKLIDFVLAEKNLVSGVFTFASSISSQNKKDIFTVGQRLNFFEQCGLDFAIVIDFNEAFAKLSGKDFFEILCSKCNLKFLAEGSDFKCGFKGSCTMEEISKLSQTLGFSLKQAEYVEYEGLKVSSSRIKKEILEGSFDGIEAMLGRTFDFYVKGQKWVLKPDSEKDNLSVFETVYSGSQVLPEKGKFSVVVHFNDGNILHTEISIEEKKLSLLLPTQNYADNAVLISF